MQPAFSRVAAALNPARAQESRGALLGRVTDPSGSVVAAGMYRGRRDLWGGLQAAAGLQPGLRVW